MTGLAQERQDWLDNHCPQHGGHNRAEYCATCAVQDAEATYRGHSRRVGSRPAMNHPSSPEVKEVPDGR